jgi:hypothetical protein
VETTASSFKFRANVADGRKRFPINSGPPALVREIIATDDRFELACQVDSLSILRRK